MLQTPQSPKSPRTRRMHGALSAAARLALVGLLPCVGCVTELGDRTVVTLPPDALRYERYIEAYGTLTADRVTIQALTAYRKDIGVITSEGYHLKRETPDRIELVNQMPEFGNDPLRLSFRNLHIQARERIDIVFSDLPLTRKEDPPVIVLIAAEGVAHLKSAGLDLIGERLIVRNDDAQGFDKEGRPLAPLPPKPPPSKR